MTVQNQIPAKDYPIVGINAQLAQDTPEYTLNMYAEKESDEVMTLKPTPGSDLTYQFTANGGGRGLNSDTGRLFGVRGAFFQEIVNGSPVILGTLLTNSGNVSIITCLPPNGAGQVLIVDQNTAYVFVFNGVSALGYASTSATSNTVQTGPLTFTIGTFLNWQPNDPIYIYETSNPLNSLTGTVTSYNPSTGDLVVNITSITGMGTLTDWTLQLQSESFVTLPASSGFVGGNSQAVFCASRGVVFKPNSTQFQVSGQYDFTTWDGTAYATCDSLKTQLIAMVSSGKLLWFFSADGFEVWQDMGYSIQPLGWVLSSRVGCLAPFSAYFFKDYTYWLGADAEGNGVFYKHTIGVFPTPISDAPTSRLLIGIPNQQNCISYAYQSYTHDFYVNTFLPSGSSQGLSIVFDGTTNRWHERAWRDPVLGQKQIVPYIAVVFYNNQLMGLSYLNGNIYTIDNQTFTDSGNPIIRQRITQVIPPEADWMTFFQSVELFGQTGNTPVSNIPVQLTMQYTLDRGETWSQESWQQVGGNSTYAARTRWTGLGSGYGMAFKFTVVCDQYISWRRFRVRAAFA